MLNQEIGKLEDWILEIDISNEKSAEKVGTLQEIADRMKKNFLRMLFEEDCN